MTRCVSDLAGIFLVENREENLPSYFARWFRDAVEDCESCSVCGERGQRGGIYLLTPEDQGTWEPLVPFVAYALCDACAGRADLDSRLRARLLSIFEPVEGRPQ